MINLGTFDQPRKRDSIRIIVVHELIDIDKFTYVQSITRESDRKATTKHGWTQEIKRQFKKWHIDMCVETRKGNEPSATFHDGCDKVSATGIAKREEN